MSRSYISPDLRRQVEEHSGQQCGYCRSQRIILGRPLTIDHIIPEAKGGKTELSNLWLACRRCNEFKAAQTTALDPITNKVIALFNPATQVWEAHFSWSDDATEILAHSPTGHVTIIALKMNNDDIRRARVIWRLTGLHPPD